MKRVADFILHLKNKKTMNVEEVEAREIYRWLDEERRVRPSSEVFQQALMVHWNIKRYSRTKSEEDLQLIRFIWTCQLGYLSLAQWLHAHGASYLTPYNFGLVARQGSLSFFKWFTAAAEKLDVLAYEEAIHLAAAQGHLSIVQWLVEQGVNLMSHSAQGFRSATLAGHRKVVNFLLSVEPRLIPLIHPLLQDLYLKQDLLTAQCLAPYSLDLEEWFASLLARRDRASQEGLIKFLLLTSPALYQVQVEILEDQDYLDSLQPEVSSSSDGI